MPLRNSDFTSDVILRHIILTLEYIINVLCLDIGCLGNF